MQEVLDDYTDVFKDELGTVKGVKVQIRVKPQAQPHYCRPRPVPYAMRQKLETELTRLQRQGVIEQVPFSEWAAPVVPVLKRDGSIRICGDYKLTVNLEATPDVYPLPRVEDLLSSLSIGVVFSNLDLAHVYQTTSNSAWTTIPKNSPLSNTSHGLFQYNRLPFGVSCVYLDDVLITDKTITDHIQNLRALLSNSSQQECT